ncbi:threonine/serine ThrE exporter family protein [Veillonella criceti]|uniref:Inner membrane protein YjjP n=1 Tax=Veillonella criceti TaxID=103891 RepID=A0A380NFJ5_9FIRM|nr:threonine/serine exporter family protein [Veillonella criceti]SUP39844.1 Inner membrane protein YjjP [Veillonella criceti]
MTRKTDKTHMGTSVHGSTATPTHNHHRHPHHRHHQIENCGPSNYQIMNEPFVAIRRKMDLLLDFGQLLMENGANTNHLQRDMIRAATYMGIPQEYVHIHIAYMTLMLNINDEKHSYTAFRKTPIHGVNMTILSTLSKLTWKAIEHNYTLDEFEDHLKTIAQAPPKYSTPILAVAAGLACGAFTILFGGSLFSAIITSICAVVGFLVRYLCHHFKINFYFGIVASAFSATSAAYLLNITLGSFEIIYAMISCTLFLIPGIPLINAVDDMINNHIVSGMTRAMHTLLIVSSMSVGIAMALYFDHVSTFTHLSITPAVVSPIQAIAATIGAVCFSIIFNTPYRLLWIIAFGGIISVITRNILIVNFGFTLVGASFVAAAIIALLALRFYKLLRTAPLILSIPSVIPLIPGVLLYRFLFGLLTINSLTPDNLLFALRSGITGLMTVICIAIGVSIPHIFARSYLDCKKALSLDKALKARQKELQE